MANKTAIKEKLLSFGYQLGCYDDYIDQLPKSELSKILDNIDYGDCDIPILIDKVKHVIEVFYVGNEVDLKLTSTKEYAKTYGRIFKK